MVSTGKRPITVGDIENALERYRRAALDAGDLLGVELIPAGARLRVEAATVGSNRQRIYTARWTAPDGTTGVLGEAHGLDWSGAGTSGGAFAALKCAAIAMEHMSSRIRWKVQDKGTS